MTSGHSNVQGVSTKSQTLLNTDNSRAQPTPLPAALPMFMDGADLLGLACAPQKTKARCDVLLKARLQHIYLKSERRLMG